MLIELMRRRGGAIVGRWFDDVMTTYAPEASAALTRQRNRFANPVGHSVRTGTRAVFDALVDGADPQAVRAGLDEMVRIRAVQELSPSEAVGFVFRLKAAIRRELEAEPDFGRCAHELVEMEERIDRAALVAFDLFVEYRRRVSELRIAEIKRTVPWVMGRANRESPVGRSGREDEAGGLSRMPAEMRVP